MKKVILLILTFGVFIMELISCGVSQTDYNTLKAENEKLKKEIADIKFGSERLLSQAKIYINNNDFTNCKVALKTLLDKHPASKEAIEAQQLLAIADNGIKENELIREKANAETEKVEKERLANATKKLRTQYDDIKGITWYYDKGTTKYNNYNSFHLYIGQEKNATPWLRLRIQYTSSDWLFIQSYVIKTDNDSYTIRTSYGDIQTDNDGGDIWEWYDTALDGSHYKMIKDIIKSKNVKLRCNGKQYYNDRSITGKEKQGLQNILDAYEALGGTTI